VKPLEAKKTFDDVWTAELEKRNEEKRQNPYKDLLEGSDEKFEASKDSLDERDYEMLRKKRLAEMKAKAARNKFGQVYEINETEWVREINEVDPDVFVVVHLMAKNKAECIHFNRTLSAIAAKFKFIKCVCIEAYKAAKGFPDELCPTVLIYKEGKQYKQIQGFDKLGGPKNSVEKFEWLLHVAGVVETDLTEVPGDTPSRRGNDDSDADPEVVQRVLREARSKIIAEDDESWLQDD